MKLHLIEGKDTYPILILVPQYNRNLLDAHYIKDYLYPGDVLVGELYMPNNKPPLAKVMDQYIQEEILPVIKDHQVQYVLISQGNYFKRLTGESKTDVNVGYIFKSHGVNVAYLPAYNRVFHDPDRIKSMIGRTMESMLNHIEGKYVSPILMKPKTIELLKEHDNLSSWFGKLLKKPALAIDIEGFDLKPFKAGVGTISFAWSEECAVAMEIEYSTRGSKNLDLLKEFLERYQGKSIYHNASYDISALIATLYMEDVADTKGLLKGLATLTRDFEDTKLIAYLATNTCAGNNLGLKSLAQPFAGNYAEDDINDITKMPLRKLLNYNAVDTLSTWYVYNTYYPQMVADEQEELYITYFKPFLIDIIQMQLTGLPLHMKRVAEVRGILQSDIINATEAIYDNPYVQSFLDIRRHEWVHQKNTTLIKKRVTYAEAKEYVEFNPNSGKQLAGLLFDHIKLPILDTTPSGQPATGKDTLEDLKAHTNEKEVLELLDNLLSLNASSKILSTFIPAFEAAEYSHWNQWHYLAGSFNLGGTVSGRLSGSNPNLQQIPSGGRYGNLIKSCFKAPPGKLLIGLDFNSLEDVISAVTTKDKNKLKVYLENYDGHCLRAYSYFKNDMPDIVEAYSKAVTSEEKVKAINSIKHLYPKLRQKSKVPTFLKTYGGTYMGLMKKAGMSEEEAKSVEANYDLLYIESIEWTKAKIAQAAKDGYVTVAFGLKVRTPLLFQTIRGNKSTPREAEAEARTAGNALGQSWCMLNNRAQNEFLSLVRSSSYANLIRPCAAIHDATYYEIPEDLSVLHFVNENLVEAVQWNDHPDIYHPEVGLGGNLAVFYPSWEHEIDLPNYATKDEIETVVNTALEEYLETNQ